MRRKSCDVSLKFSTRGKNCTRFFSPLILFTHRRGISTSYIQSFRFFFPLLLQVEKPKLTDRNGFIYEVEFNASLRSFFKALVSYSRFFFDRILLSSLILYFDILTDIHLQRIKFSASPERFLP